MAKSIKVWDGSSWQDVAIAIPNIDDLATQAYVANAISSSAVDLSTAAGNGIDWNVNTSQFDINTSELGNAIAFHGVTAPTNKQPVTYDSNFGLVTSTPDFSSYATLISPAFSGYVSLPETTSIGNVFPTEIGYLQGITSSVQTQIDSKVSINGASTITPGTISTVGLTIKGAPSQSASLQEWQNSSGTIVGQMYSSGYLKVTSLSISGVGVGTSHLGFTGTYTGTSIAIGTNSSSILPLVVTGTTGQSTVLQRWDSSPGTPVANINASGDLSVHKATVTSAPAGSSVLRNITLSVSDPSGGSDGDVWFKYTV